VVSAQSQTPQGSGTENDPYLITSLQDLEWINIEGEFDKHYKQTKNIDLKGASYRDDDTFIPLGNLGNKGNRKNTTENLQEFTGTYDGNNKQILHLSSNPGGNHVGFIGELGQGGELKDLVFVRAKVSGGHSTGIAVGNNNGTVERVEIAGGEVEHVVNDNDFANTGGLVGRNNQNGKIKNSFSNATVIGHGKQIGGLVGVNRPGGVIEGSSAFANVTNKALTNVNDRTGGLVGSNGGNISFSYAVARTDIQVTGEHAVGGLVGRNTGTIYYCFARVDVKGETYVGGLVGAAVNKDNGDNPQVTATYATGNVSGTDYVGGLLGGGKSGKESSGKVELSYSIGRVTGTGNNVGGFAGSDVNTKKSNYWNTKTSDQYSSAFGQPKTDAEMYDESNFNSPFKGVFKWQNGVYKSFPYFKSAFTYDRTDRETPLPNIPGQVKNNGSMVIVIDTDYSSDLTMSLPLMKGADLQIDWGDGTLQDVSSAGVVEHTYVESSTGEKVIRLNGSLKTFGDWTQSYDGAKMIKSIFRWGDLGITEFKSAFKGASNLTSVPNSLPTEVTTIQGMFTDATSFNDANISSWDVSNVTRMSRLFRGASSFNQDISDWDVSNVTGFGLTFLDASSFNQDITEWDVSSATHMNEMFRNATDFDQDLSAWDVSSVTNMSYMFQGASSFNNGGEPLTWTTSGSLLNIRNMFKDAVAFNQQVGSWDVSNVTNMQAVFNGASSFNRELKNWDVAKVENMQFMFGPGNKQMVFNKDISGWDVSSVTKMNGMFRGANEFNQDIGEWDVSEVEQMNKMFEGADAFNQDISGWTVSNVLTMESMFKYATSFNQNLGEWPISGVTNMAHMFKGTALSTQNYSNTLIGWAQQSGLQSGVKLDADAKFTPEAKSSRSKLINEYDWNISDGGELGSESFPTVSSPNVSDITSNAATFSASVTDSGDSATRGHGFVWSSESKTPKLNDNSVRGVYLDGNTKSFSWTETDLSVNTQYWVRSYATNDEGTSYGEDVVTFSTTPELSSDFSLASNGVTILCPEEKSMA
jgi:surface protein